MLLCFYYPLIFDSNDPALPLLSSYELVYNKKQPRSLTRSVVSRGAELSDQITLLSPPESSSCLLRIAITAQEMTARVSGPWIRNNLLLRRAAGSPR